MTDDQSMVLITESPVSVNDSFLPQIYAAGFVTIDDIFSPFGWLFSSIIYALREKVKEKHSALSCQR